MLIELRNVRKTYRLGDTEVQALRGADLGVRKGDFTALVGASGSGKSTLLNLIGCIDEADSGEIIIDGTSVARLGEREKSVLRNRKIGFIFQAFNLIPVLSAYENVELPLVIQSEIPARVKRERILAAMRDVGLAEKLEHRPDQLSGGERQRVAIARALVTQPALVLADEPTANLDSGTANKIIDLMLDLNAKRGVTFFFCTHDEKLISRVANVVHIRDGVIHETSQK